MKTKKTYRMLAVLLAVVMVFGALPVTATARSAGDDGSVEMNEAYAAHESLMPIGPSFNVDTLLEWTPESDPDAAYSRASIALADRVGGFVVNPLANPEAKLMLCSMANSDHDNTNAQGSESFFTYAFNYWQYADSFVYWSGSEEGLVCCPTGEFTDAAHTNGVPVVATLGFPWGYGSTYVEQVRKFVQKAADGSFPVADKLIEVMDYYGFDGYFFNQESYGCSATEGALIDEMMRYMHKKRPDMLISWYDSMLPSGGVSYQDAVNNSNKQFLTDSEDGTRAIDEFFMNYNWNPSKIDTTISTMKSIGRSQFDAFAGFNVQANVYGDRLADHLLVDEDGLARLSLALFCANMSMSLATDGEEFHETEKGYYVNAKGDPRDTSVNVSDSTVTQWAGLSRFFADKSPVVKVPFVTNFNTGHGKGYYVDGQLSRDGEWSYQSNQDVLPTWTWIIDSQGEKLTGGYDFDDAYHGGNSIRFYGNLTAGQANQIMLYSTKVTVESGMKLGLTYKGDQGFVSLVAYTGDAGTDSYEACEKTVFPLTRGADGVWTTEHVDLSNLAGKTLYAIGLQVESADDVTDYQVNLGQLTLTEKTRAALNGPAQVTLDEILYRDAYTAEARVYWTPVTGAASYEIYQVNPDGSRALVMETPNTAYYIPTLNRDEAEEDVTLEVVPINRNGVRGKAGTLVIDWAYGNADSEKVVTADFENVCLNAEVTGFTEQGDGAECSKALDGTSANNSKWWASGAHDWMSIDLGRPCTIRRWRVEHAEAGGEDKKLNTDTFALEYKNASGSWVEAKRITGNTDAITDVLLDEPVTAQEWRLYIYKCGPSLWTAVNIYEWQMFETAEFPQTVPVPMHFVSASNGAGATDTVTLQHVPVGNTVKIYLKSDDTYTLIGETVAASATVQITGLDFGTTEAGRVYYTITSSGAAESAKLSVPFEAEHAEKSTPAENVSFQKYSHPASTTSSNGDDIYTTRTVKNLAPGDVLYVYENGTAAGYTKASLPVSQGATEIAVNGVRVARAGGSLALQVKRAGKTISDVYTVNTPQFAEPTAVVVLYATNESGESLTGVRYGVYGEDGNKVTELGTTSDSGGKATVPLGTYTLKCEAVPAGYLQNSDMEMRILRIENWTYEVRVTLQKGDQMPEKIAAAKAELQAYYDALVAGNRYSGEGTAQLQETLSAGMTALEACTTEEDLSVALEEAKAALDAVPTYEEELHAVKAAAEAAQKAAEEAQKKAEEAQKAAEEAQKAAEEAAASTAEDKGAAEAAKAAAEAAQAKAEAAKAAAEVAQTAAETAAQAAEASNLAAAQEAAKAAEEALKAAQEASNAARSAEAAAEAQRAAQAAQAKAEEAQAKAEEAQKAAEEAAASAAEDKTAAEAARVKAEEAQAQAEAAQAAAETAKTAAEAASAAAEQFQLAAAEEARKSAEEAAKSAASAAAAAESAAQAAEAMVKAQAAQAAAEAAAKTAEEAQKKAEEAQKKAEEAAQSSAEDKEAAEKAAREAKAAKEAAENAQKSAEEAKRAAQTAKEAAENANVEAAAAAALAAEYAQKVTETYNEIVKIKAEMVEFLAEAQKAAEQAEAERKAAEEARKKAEEAALQSGKYHALIVLSTYADKNDYAPTQQEALAAAIQAGKEAIDAAATLQEVEEALAAAKAAIDRIPTLAELMPFTDVKEDAWYYEAVLYAMQEGYFKGVTATTFAPESKLSRAMAVTVLYRMAGEPEVTGTVTFTDVKEDAYYYQALVWAVENGITTGIDNSRFAPNANVTREQMVTFLYRYAKASGADVSKQADLSQYRDVKQVSEYAEEAMAWAVGSGILQGMEQNLLAPRGTATRAQAAAILMRYSKLA